MKNRVTAAFAALIIACSIAVVTPAAMSKPAWNGGHYPDAMDWKKGIVTGTLGTVYLGTGDTGGAYVAIINAANVSEEYYNTTADARGNFRFTGVNATYSSRLGRGSPAFGGNYTRGTNAYRIYASTDRYGEGYSAPFGIDEDQTAATSVAIHTGPTRIEVRAERVHVTDDSADNVKLTAYVYDTLGNPVPDGTQVNFTIGNAMSNAYNGGFNWSMGNGSFSASPGSGTFITVTNGGAASVRFGWTPEGVGGDNSTVWAYINGTDIYSTTRIYFSEPTASWTGYVIDPSGFGLGGISVTLHVMGMDSSGPYEIYNMTRTTSSPPYAGLFAFDYIVMSGVAYGYVDAEARTADNRTIYGKSGNFSMNGSFPSIVVNMASPNATIASPSAIAMASPSAPARPTPGLKAPIALAGLLGASYMLFRRE